MRYHLTKEMYTCILICKGMLVHFYIIFRWIINYYYIGHLFLLLFIILFLLHFKLYSTLKLLWE